MNDISLIGIITQAQKHVYPFVNVYITQIDSKYHLRLNVNDYSSSYELHPIYMRDPLYIMRVVSDLCIRLARLCDCERNCFYKMSDSNE